MGTLVAIAVVTLLAVALRLLSHTRYGELRLMEVPGFIAIMIAGRRYRSQAAEILRARKSERS
jgi:hypothetical protein